MSAAPRYASLIDIISKLQGARDAGCRIVSSVILTYEFDPELAFSLAQNGVIAFDGEDASMFRWSGAFPAVLFYDPARTQPGRTVPGSFEIRFWRRSGRGCHHAKAYAFQLSDGSAELVLGSFNFTSSGLATNREVLLRFHLDRDNRAFRCVFAEWHELLKKHYVPRAQESPGLATYMEGLEALLAQTQDAPTAPVRLLASGMDMEESGLAALERFAKSEQLTEPVELIAVTPFFDGGASGPTFLGQLLKAFPTIKTAHIFSDIPDNAWPAHALAAAADRSVHLNRWRIPQTIDDVERRHLAEYFRGSSADCKDQDLEKVPAITRRLHAKLLILRDLTGQALLYAGSANFTAKAWFGRNVELGAVMMLADFPASAPKVWVARFFGFSPERIALVSAPMTEDTSAALDPEDEADSSFPAEIASAELALADAAHDTPGSGLCGDFGLERSGCFIVHAAPDAGLMPDLADKFSFFWNGLQLSFEWSPSKRVWHSKPIDGSTLRSKLLEPRVIEAVPLKLEGKDSIFIPFNIAAGLGAASELTFSTDPSESLSFLASLLAGRRLNLRRKESDEHADLSSNSSDDLQVALDASQAFAPMGSYAVAAGAERNANTAIAMQRWLATLSELENALFDENERLRNGVCRADLPAYLDAVSAIAAGAKASAEPVSVFYQTGELLLLARRINKALSVALDDSRRSSACVSAVAWNSAIGRMEKRFCAAARRLPAETRALRLTTCFAEFVLGRPYQALNS